MEACDLKMESMMMREHVAYVCVRARSARNHFIISHRRIRYSITSKNITQKSTLEYKFDYDENSNTNTRTPTNTGTVPFRFLMSRICIMVPLSSTMTMCKILGIERERFTDCTVTHIFGCGILDLVGRFHASCFHYLA